MRLVCANSCFGVYSYILVTAHIRFTIILHSIGILVVVLSNEYDPSIFATRYKNDVFIFLTFSITSFLVFKAHSRTYDYTVTITHT